MSLSSSSFAATVASIIATDADSDASSIQPSRA
jgi:hypothetical protein